MRLPGLTRNLLDGAAGKKIRLDDLLVGAFYIGRILCAVNYIVNILLTKCMEMRKLIFISVNKFWIDFNFWDVSRETRVAHVDNLCGLEITNYYRKS